MNEILEWKIVTGDEKLRIEIQKCKDTFENWFNGHWSKRCTREKMLSEDSPIEHVYYKMCKSFDEVKEKYPLEATERCSSCGKDVSEWIETSFSFCDEYGCGMTLCRECAETLHKKIHEFVSK